MQKHLNKILVFIINLLLMVIAVLIIKNQDQKNLAIKTETDSTTNPIDRGVLDAQTAISTDRENKLRALNGTPQEFKKQQITTTTNTSVSAPSSSSTSSRTTKKS
jgi:hypothetical protein